MFKCCICHREYSTKEAAVKCVNECGRKMTADGVFKPKSAPQGVKQLMSMNIAILLMKSKQLRKGLLLYVLNLLMPAQINSRLIQCKTRH